MHSRLASECQTGSHLLVWQSLDACFAVAGLPSPVCCALPGTVDHNSAKQLLAPRAEHTQRRLPVLPCGAQKQKVLATLGRDDASAGSACLKLWGLDGVRPGGAPACQRTLRCFAPAGKAAEAAVTAAALHADAWPHLALALGLADGAVLLLRGEAGARAACLRSQSSGAEVCGAHNRPHKRPCHAETWSRGAAGCHIKKSIVYARYVLPQALASAGARRQGQGAAHHAGQPRREWWAERDHWPGLQRYASEAGCALPCMRGGAVLEADGPCCSPGTLCACSVTVGPRPASPPCKQSWVCIHLRIC